MADDIPLYDPEILNKYNLGERHETLKLDDSLVVRPLYASDYDRGFLDLLKELTEVGDISKEKFLGKLRNIRCSHSICYLILTRFFFFLL